VTGPRRSIRDATAQEATTRRGVDAARERFGGKDLPASIAGMLVALAALLLLAGLASAAIGAIAFQTGVEGNEDELSLGALIVAGAVIFLAFLLGGWAAGRMARYNGALNGFMVAVWFIVLGVVLAAVGAIAGNTYNLFDDLASRRLPAELVLGRRRDGPARFACSSRSSPDGRRCRARRDLGTRMQRASRSRNRLQSSCRGAPVPMSAPPNTVSHRIAGYTIHRSIPPSPSSATGAHSNMNMARTKLTSEITPMATDICRSGATRTLAASTAATPPLMNAVIANS
jgi:hypothetical protein